MTVHVIHFDDMFINLIKEGKKFSTIRKPRRRMINVGDDLLFYTANPSLKNEYIGRGKCTDINPVVIYEDLLMLGDAHINNPKFLNKFAKTEGFGGWVDLIYWFKKNEKLPYSGLQTEWELIDKELTF